MQTVATNFSELAGILGTAKPATVRQPISDWEEYRISLIGSMLELVRKSKLHYQFDIRRNVFTFEKQSLTKYKYRRFLWLDGETWVFGDNENHYARLTNAHEMVEKVTRWINSKLVKK